MLGNIKKRIMLEYFILYAKYVSSSSAHLYEKLDSLTNMTYQHD